MSRHEDLGRVLNSGIVAVIRSTSSEQLVEVAKALYEGGVDVLEITLTVPRALEIISAVRKSLGDKVLLGAGTVLDPETARAAFLAGAEFLVAPTVNLDVIKLGNRYDKLVMPGAFTPTEILTAWEAGAQVIKVFPADIGGPAYLKTLHGPLPQVRLLPTGGVNLTTLPDFLKAGACAVGLGGALVEPKAVQAGDMARITNLSQQYVELVKKTRAGMNPTKE
ncbi:MAG: bifunctional 4-hydroxy-2-oxoglutarate aldolase/2-dehydro-3-deoxy-phosphogluconate aldolase [Planctomycetaceae bacterium]|nr:bifunctional 4-hydroxy-2-oxoglutarate aldolase/2-dehydro-3-deoxy-phosphogluconate aldolase [Planctomycetaceae bacterium]